MAFYNNNPYNPYNSSQSWTQNYPMQQQYQLPQAMNNIVINVQGIDAAKAYPLSPNTRGYFFDTEKDFLYIKEIGLDGLQTKPVKVIKCEEATEADLTEKKEQPQYITKDMLEDFLATYLDEHQYKPYIPKKKNPS